MSPITAETLSETFHSIGYFCVVSLVKDVIWLILFYYIICSKTFTPKVNLYWYCAEYIFKTFCRLHFESCTYPENHNIDLPPYYFIHIVWILIILTTLNGISSVFMKYRNMKKSISFPPFSFLTMANSNFVDFQFSSAAIYWVCTHSMT